MPGHIFLDEPARSECVQEIDQVSLLLVAETNIETLVVEIDHVTQGGSRTVVEIGRTRRKPTQDWPLEAADIFALATDQSWPGSVT